MMASATLNYIYELLHHHLNSVIANPPILCNHNFILSEVLSGCLYIWQNKIPGFSRFFRLYKPSFPNNYKLKTQYYKSAWKWIWKRSCNFTLFYSSLVNENIGGLSRFHINRTSVVTTITTIVLRPFFLDQTGEPVPEENFWTLWCKGRLTEADTLTIRLGATPSGLTSAHLHHPPIIFFMVVDALPVTQPTVSKHWRQLAHSDWGEDARVLLNGVMMD